MEQERVMDSWDKKSKFNWGNRSGTTSSAMVGNRSSTFNIKGVSDPTNQRNKLFEARKAQGLCYRCGEKYFVGHQCKPKQLNAMTADDMELRERSQEELQLQEGEIMDEAISLHALSGVEMPNTIRLRGEAKKNSLTIQVDSGSTHSFLDLETAKQIGCPITRVGAMRVTVADGNHILSLHNCPKFRWKIQGVEFEDSIRLLRLGGNNMVLGGDWMKLHNPVLLDFVDYKIQVTHHGKRILEVSITKEN